MERSITARVPCIDHDGFMLSESLAIIEYLDDSFSGPAYPSLLPRGTLPRARARQLLGWLRSDLLPLRDERPTTTMFHARATKPLGAKAQAAADKLLRIAEQVIPRGEGELFGNWSAADGDLAFMLHRLILNGDPVPERVARYATRQWSRPSIRGYVEQKRPPQSVSS
jgi:glutathione S-transferase